MSIAHENMTKKHIRFAPYIDVHMRYPVRDSYTQYPSERIVELEHINERLKGELLRARQSNDVLNNKLKNIRSELIRANTNNHEKSIWIAVLIFVYMIMLCWLCYASVIKTTL